MLKPIPLRQALIGWSHRQMNLGFRQREIGLRNLGVGVSPVHVRTFGIVCCKPSQRGSLPLHAAVRCPILLFYGQPGDGLRVHIHIPFPILALLISIEFLLLGQALGYPYRRYYFP